MAAAAERLQAQRELETARATLEDEVRAKYDSLLAAHLAQRDADAKRRAAAEAAKRDQEKEGQPAPPRSRCMCAL